MAASKHKYIALLRAVNVAARVRRSWNVVNKLIDLALAEKKRLQPKIT